MSETKIKDTLKRWDDDINDFPEKVCPSVPLLPKVRRKTKKLDEFDLDVLRRKVLQLMHQGGPITIITIHQHLMHENKIPDVCISTINNALHVGI